MKPIKVCHFLLIFQEFLTYLSFKHISFLYPLKTEGESADKTVDVYIFI